MRARLLTLALVATAFATLSHAQVGTIPQTGGGTNVTQWGGIYQPNSNSAQIAPYNHAVTLHATGNCCTDFAHSNNFTDASWMMFGANYRIRQTGLVTSISFSWGNPTTTNQYTALYFIICRPAPGTTAWNQVPTANGTGGDCPVVAKSQNLLSSLTAGAVNTVTITTPMYVRDGDFYGFESQGTFGSTGAVDDRFYYEAASCGGSTGQSHCYLTGTVSTLVPQAYPWSLSYGGETDYAIPVALNISTAPVGVMIGDSIFAGATRRSGVVGAGSSGSLTFLNDPTSQISYYIEKATGWPIENMGISSQTSTQIAARFSSDVVALHPKFVVIEAGVNDVAQSVSESTWQSNWTSMLTAAQAAGIVPYCVLILPWQNGTNTNGSTIDTWNSWLNGQCEQYGGYTVDARPYVGQFRTGGNIDNLWNIRPEYMSVGDNLQIHYSTLGYQAIAKAILDKMGVTNAFPFVPKRASWYLKSQSLTSSVASTTVYCQTEEPWFPTTCESGMYHLRIYMSAMASGSGGSVTASFTFSDPGTPGNTNQSYTLTSNSLSLASLPANLMYETDVVLDGLTNPTFSTSYSTAGTYQVFASLDRID